jgi:hypothetical protein
MMKDIELIEVEYLPTFNLRSKRSLNKNYGGVILKRIERNFIPILPVLLLAFMFAFPFMGCGCSNDASDNSGAIVSISISPENPIITVGGTKQLAANATASNNDIIDITDDVIWSSSDENIATISNNGLVTGITEGTAVISAKYQMTTIFPVTTLSASTTVTVNSPSFSVGNVKGRVTDATTGLPIEGVAINITENRGQTTTDFNGEYTLNDIPAGLQTLSGTKTGYVNFTQTVEVIAGETTTSADIPMNPASAETGSVKGTVSDYFTEDPLSGARVTIGGIETLSDSEGAYTINGLTPGVNNVTAVMSGYSNFAGTVEVISGAETPYPIVMNPYDTVFSTNPENEATNVPIDQTIEITFVNNVALGSGIDDVTVIDEFDVPVDPLNISVLDNVLRIAHPDFEYDTTYYVFVPTSAVQNGAREMLTDLEFSFTTAGPPFAADKAISGGLYHTVALKDDGTVWAWGRNHTGQLGNNDTGNSSTPVQVVGQGGSGYLTDVLAVAGGNEHTVVLKNDNTVWAWGRNCNGQLGNNSTDNSSTPVQVVGPGGVDYLTNVIAISTGNTNNHIIALKDDGTVWGWGDNWYGQLGVGSISQINTTPIQTLGPEGSGYLTNIIAIAAGWSNTITIKDDGNVWAWGNNWYGKLGNNTNTDSLTPVQSLIDLLPSLP